MLYTESLTLLRQAGDKRDTATPLTNLGDIARFLHEWERATELYIESLKLCGEVGEKRSIACCLDGLAAVSLGQGDALRAAQLFGASDALREAVGSPLLPAHSADHDFNLTATRDALGKDAFAEASWKGRAMTQEQAIALALLDSGLDSSSSVMR